MGKQFEWQFHFRNFNENEMHVRVHHAGCAKDPWHDGRPACWEKDIPYCPQGSNNGEAVYVPSAWVTNFGDWWSIIKDGLKLIKDLGVVFFPPVKSGDVIDVISDVFAIEKDIITALIDDMSEEELNEMLETAHDSIDNTCKNSGMNPTIIRQIAEDMNLDPSNWAILAGSDYKRYIHNNESPLVNNHGWSNFRGWGQKTKDDLKIATACFIEKGHIIFPVHGGGGDSDVYNEIMKFWNEDFNG
ncbi:hypothetical protein [Nostoc sp.]|uniref:hypothetical protein n=1 Tax=Nostoc sp. TaxID=1180 RepID=UPI002FFB1ECF